MAFGPPATPTKLKCEVAGGYAKVSCSTGTASVDRIYFYISPQDKPNRHVYELTVRVQSGDVEGVIPIIGAGSRVVLTARAHQKGRPENAGPHNERSGKQDFWSDVSLKAECVSAKASGSFTLAKYPAPAVKTRWIEVFRHQRGEGSLPDGLDENNGASIGGYAVPLSSTSGPTVRYCVEIQDRTFDNVITDNFGAKPMQSNYANYLSCNRGECECMAQADRTIARQPLDIIQKMCKFTASSQRANNFCRCDEKGDMERSLRFVGRAILGSPFKLHKNWVGKVPDKLTGYPGSTQGSLAWWYSFPQEGRCRPDEAVGTNGCTWQRHHIAQILSNDAVPGYTTDIGDIKPDPEAGKYAKIIFVDENITKNNIEAAKNAWAAAGAPECGPVWSPTWGRKARGSVAASFADVQREGEEAGF